MFKKQEKRIMIGLVEPIVLENKKTYKAKIDTGADSSSIDETLVKSLGDKKVVSHKVVRSALGKHRRPTVYLEIEFQGKKFKEKFTISDRKDLKFKILIGKDILKKEGFLVDPRK
jgi:hypothetical protein